MAGDLHSFKMECCNKKRRGCEAMQLRCVWNASVVFFKGLETDRKLEKIARHNACSCSALLILKIDPASVSDYKELFVSWLPLRLKNISQFSPTISPAERRPLAEQQDGVDRLCCCHSAVRLLGNQWTVTNTGTLCQWTQERSCINQAELQNMTKDT